MIKEILALKALRHILLNLRQKLNSLTFLLTKFFCSSQNQYDFCFGKNHSRLKPIEQLISLNDLIQMSIINIVKSIAQFLVLQRFKKLQNLKDTSHIFSMSTPTV